MPNSFACCNGECGWMQTVSQNTVIGNSHVASISSDVFSQQGDVHSKPSFGNQFRQQPPLSGIQLTAAEWTTLRCKPDTTLCNFVQGDSHQPPILPASGKHCAAQTNYSSSTSTAHVRFNLGHYNQAVPQNCVTHVRMENRDSGLILSNAAGRMRYPISHSSQIFDSANVAGSKSAITFPPTQSHYGGANKLIPVKMSPNRSQSSFNTRLVYEQFIQCSHVSARNRSAYEQVTSEAWTALHPLRNTRHPNTKDITGSSDGSLNGFEWLPRSDNSIWCHIPHTRPGRKLTRTEGDKSEPSRWITISQHAPGVIISRGQLVQPPLNGSTNVRGNAHDTVKSYRVRLHHQRPR